ncbi:MAG: TrkH family potassium uptake protein [Burkholderiaceae bacterium]|nr:TrkH family potassium uptake protein [Burkholderiaceae bacterium]MCD8536034.1 TrkH family potassium uptake protein [Burkholderiaceae bacterium]MCD8564138.1 TrkH family potassium uptake protein [Burkholderiaceae bacterium]
MKRLLAVIHVLGFTMALFATTMFVPMVWSVLLDDGQLILFIESFAIALFLGAALWLSTLKYRAELRPRDGFLLVTLVWGFLPLLGTIPLLLYFHDIGSPLKFSDAYFESMSGLTATGATLLSGLDNLAPTINLWRVTMHWVGGMGIIVLAVAILPLLGVGGHQLFRAETPGPMKEEKLTPRIASTAKALYAIYFGLSIACFLAYRAAGMSWFDAWCYMASTVALGGFAPHDASIGYFNSPLIETIAIVFMLLSGINYATHFNAFRLGSIKAYRRCPEAIPFVGIVLGMGIIIGFYLWFMDVYPDIQTAIRYAVFNTVSIATTAGFASTDYEAWPLIAPLAMIALGMFSTSSGSTGGGIKMIRAMMLVKQTRQEMISILHPHAVTPVLLKGRLIPARVLASVLAFMLLYGFSIAVLTALMLLSGADATTAFTSVIACVNNIGPGLGEVGPAKNYLSMNDFQVWILSFAMMIGRLELFTVLVLFSAGFWRK